MNLHELIHRTHFNRRLFFRQALKPARMIVTVSALFALNGCLITSPYFNQNFSNHTQPIPIQTWIGSPNKDVRIQCAQAYHAGLYPFGGDPTWVNVTTIKSQGKANFAPDGSATYSAGKSMVLPAACWRKDPANNIWYSALRAYRLDSPSSKFDVVNLSGLECVGRENGKAASWLGYFSKNCALTYSGSSTKVPYVIFYANN